MLRPSIHVPTFSNERTAKSLSMPCVPPLCPVIFLKASVGKNQPCSSNPRTPRGFCRSCQGPAPNPSFETEKAPTRILLTIAFLYKSLSVYQRHHLWRVPFSNYFNSPDCGFDFLQIALGELYPKRAHVVLQIPDPLRSGYRHEIIALGKHPSQRQLRRRASFLPCELLHRICELEICLQRLFAESR